MTSACMFSGQKNGDYSLESNPVLLCISHERTVVGSSARCNGDQWKTPVHAEITDPMIDNFGDGALLNNKYIVKYTGII